MKHKKKPMSHHIKRFALLKFILIIGVLFESVAILRYGTYAHRMFLHHTVGGSIVLLQGQADRMMWTGTGFAVNGASGKNYIMTNAHVCGTAKSLKIYAENGKIYTRPVLKKFSDHDLCLVGGVDDLTSLKLSSEDADVADIIYVIGHPMSQKLTISEGEVVGTDRIEVLSETPINQCTPPPRYQVVPFDGIPEPGHQPSRYVCVEQFKALTSNITVLPGNSGSPVVNWWGRVTGVAFASNQSRMMWGSIIPLDQVKKFLDQN